MTKEALLTEILRLSPEERIELLGEAWDAMAATPEDVPIPEWHVQELERRNLSTTMGHSTGLIREQCPVW